MNKNLPGFVVMCPGIPTVGPQLWTSAFLPAAHQGVHIKNDEKTDQLIPYIAPQRTAEAQRRQIDLLAKLNHMRPDDCIPTDGILVKNIGMRPIHPGFAGADTCRPQDHADPDTNHGCYNFAIRICSLAGLHGNGKEWGQHGYFENGDLYIQSSPHTLWLPRAYYFHFSTKEDILLELLRMWTEDRTRVLAAGADTDASPRETLHQTLAAFLSYVDVPEWPGVLLEFWAQAIRNPEVSKRLTLAYASWRKTITDVFEQAAESGVIRSESAGDAAAVALAAHDGYAVQVAIGSPGGRLMSAADITDALIAPLETAAADTERRAIAQ